MGVEDLKGMWEKGMNDMLDLVEMWMMKDEGLSGKACIERSDNRFSLGHKGKFLRICYQSS